MIIKYDIKKIKEILGYFYTLTSVRVCVFDENFNEIAFCPENLCDFCKNIRLNPKLKKKCEQSDKNAFIRCKKEGAFTYKCHMGLIESVAPIKFEDITIGFLIFGQLRPESGEKEYVEILKDYNICNLNLDEYYRGLKILTIEQLDAAAKILNIIASSIYQQKLASVYSGELIVKLEHYINGNLGNKLDSGVLCKKFCISRTKLFNLSKTFFGMGIMRYITQKRINIAKELLSSSDISVSEAAAKVGISDYNYFTKIFKKYENSLPKNYKK